MQNKQSLTRTIQFLLLTLSITGCSTTSSLEPGEQLYTGMKPTEYIKDNTTPSLTSVSQKDHFIDTKEEVEAVLACAPNGALFGSSYYRTPFPWGLWIWNAFSQKKGAIPKWLTSSFGKAPVLISDVKPELRMSVAKTVLENNGYFRGNIQYKIHEGKPTTTRRDSVMRPHKAKVSYTVDMGPVFTIDSIAYKGYSEEKYQKPGNVFLGVVHRLDRPVYGLVLFARTSKALPRLNKMFQNKEGEEGVRKIYWAIVPKAEEKKSKNAEFLPDGFTRLTHWLSRNEKQNKSYAYDSERHDTKKAILDYKIIGSSDRYQLVEIRLLTGRHHQIRCQLAKIGLPIKGDLKYGAPRSNPNGSISLLSRKMEFTHPVSKEPVSITAPLPDDKLWKALEP